MENDDAIRIEDLWRRPGSALAYAAAFFGLAVWRPRWE
jgi:hypothetical protein